MEAIVLADAALALAEKLYPMIQAAIQKGEVSAEAQAQLKARIDRLRTGDAFRGPEWELSDAAKVETFPPRPNPPHGSASAASAE